MIAALALCRAVHDTALLLLAGIGIFARFLAPAPLARAITPPLRPLASAAAWVAVATTILWLMLEAGTIGNGWADSANPAVLGPVLTDTGFGHVWIARLALAVLLAVLAATGRIDRWAVTLPVVGALLASLALVGHAAALGGLPGTLHRLSDALHLLGAAAWPGSLVPLLAALARLRDPTLKADALVALRRFSAMGYGAVALVVATGVVNSALIIGLWPIHWAAAYPRLLLVKIVLVAAMIAVACANGFCFAPALRRRAAGAGKNLTAGTIVEIVLAVAVVALVGLFGLLDPMGMD